MQALRARGMEPRIRYTVTEFATQLAFVARGLTAALVPRMAQRPCPPGVRFVPLRPALRREVRAAWRAGADSPSVRACVAALTGGTGERSGLAQQQFGVAVRLTAREVGACPRRVAGQLPVERGQSGL